MDPQQRLPDVTTCVHEPQHTECMHDAAPAELVWRLYLGTWFVQTHSVVECRASTAGSSHGVAPTGCLNLLLITDALMRYPQADPADPLSKCTSTSILELRIAAS